MNSISFSKIKYKIFDNVKTAQIRVLIDGLTKKERLTLTVIAVTSLATLLFGLSITAAALILTGEIFLITSIALLSLNFIKQDYDRFVKRHSGNNVKNQNVVIFFNSSHDHNGALSIPQFGFFAKYRLPKKYKVVFKKVSSFDEIEKTVDKMKEQNNRIKVVWINAHGNESGFKLKKFSSKGDQYKFRRCFSKLDDDASIVLQSCSTGKLNGKGTANIAQIIADAAPGRRVIAPIRDVKGCGTKINSKDCTARFTDAKRVNNPGLVGKISNFFLFASYAISFGNLCGESITATYCNKFSYDLP